MSAFGRVQTIFTVYGSTTSTWSMPIVMIPKAYSSFLML